MKRNYEDYNPYKNENYSTSDQKHKDLDKKRKIVLVTVALIGVLVVGTLIFAKKTSSGGDDDTNFVPLIPIWVAVFIPLLASKKNKAKQISDKERIRIIFSVLAAVLLLVGIIIFFTFQSN